MIKSMTGVLESSKKEVLDILNSQEGLIEEQAKRPGYKDKVSEAIGSKYRTRI